MIEYKTIAIRPSGRDTKLNDMSEKGWNLTHVVNDIHYFEREKNDTYK
jgi:hypothetical protein